jgi:uncharacterized protein involved in exopolysaccharide biosynthesis
MAGRLSEAAYARRAQRLGPDHATRTWAAASHLTASPNLWAELAALRGGAQPEPWIEASLTAHLAGSRADAERRLEAMAAALAGESADERRTR